MKNIYMNCERKRSSIFDLHFAPRQSFSQGNLAEFLMGFWTHVFSSKLMERKLGEQD